MVSKTLNASNFETCIQNLINQAELTKSQFIKSDCFEDDNFSMSSYQLTASKKLILQILESFDSQPVKI
jgi:hypothetical protein